MGTSARHLVVQQPEPIGTSARHLVVQQPEPIGTSARHLVVQQLKPIGTSAATWSRRSSSRSAPAPPTDRAVARGDRHRRRPDLMQRCG
jgi:hypothetical protein